MRIIQDLHTLINALKCVYQYRSNFHNADQRKVEILRLIQAFRGDTPNELVRYSLIPTPTLHKSYIYPCYLKLHLQASRVYVVYQFTKLTPTIQKRMIKFLTSETILSHYNSFKK